MSFFLKASGIKFFTEPFQDILLNHKTQEIPPPSGTKKQLHSLSSKNMKIPHPLPQFENTTALLLVSGEFEAHFYTARNGFIEHRQTIRHIPREEIIGKDWGFREGKIESTPSSGSVSSAGIRRINLKKKFREEIDRTLDEMTLYNGAQEIYLVGPRNVLLDILKKTDRRTKIRIRGKHDGEHIKKNPVEILSLLQIAQEG
jgi:hypothetical protein